MEDNLHYNTLTKQQKKIYDKNPLTDALLEKKKQFENLDELIETKQAPPFQVYQEKPKSIPMFKMLKNMDLVKKYIMIKFSLEAKTVQEAYILKEIRYDYNKFQLYSYRVSFLTFIAIVGKIALSIGNSPIPLQVACIGAAAYMFRLENIMAVFSYWRMSYYLNLMQLGNDFKLGRETHKFIKFINENDKTGMSKELKQIIEYDLNTLLLYNRGQIILENEFSARNNDEEDLRKGTLKFQEMLSMKRPEQKTIADYKDILESHEVMKQVKANQEKQKNQLPEERYEDLYQYILDNRKSKI